MESFVFGICDNCCAELSTQSTLRTRKSKVFRGNNYYVLCNNCNQIMLYNLDRKLLFNLDKYKDNEEVIAEIEEYFEELGEMIEVAAEPPAHACSGNCGSCSSCGNGRAKSLNKEEVEEELIPFDEEHAEEIKAVEEEVFSDKVEEHLPEKELINYQGWLYIVNRKNPDARFVLPPEQLNELKDIDEWDFYLLDQVMIEPVVSYKIHRQ